MSAPRSIRLEEQTLSRLAAYAARHPGMSSASAAALLVEEGLRMDEHPGIRFREGPAGRRPGLVDGPDVWEVVRALRDVRRDNPKLSPERVKDLVVRTSSLTAAQVQVALAYYGAFADEIDAEVAQADRAEDTLRESIRRTHELLGS